MPPGTSSTGTALDSATRQFTRIRLLFSLAGRVGPDSGRPRRLLDEFDFGRFTPHLRSSEAVLPVPVLAVRAAPEDLELPYGDHGLTLGALGLLVVTTPRGDATLLMECDFTGNTPADAVGAWLATTCFEREHLKLGGHPLLEVLTERLSLPESLAFGQNVHQLLLPGGRLLTELLGTGDHDEARRSGLLNEIIYRGRMPTSLDGDAAPHLSVTLPPNLHNHGVTLSAHGRGVSVQAGWAPHVENGLTLVALGLVSALAVLQRTRLAAFAMMRQNEQALTDSPYEVRSLISRLSDGVNELQLDLAFGVEAYVDSLLIPERLLEGFQLSLRDALGIRDSLDNSARMVERLTSVIDARSAALDAALAERDDRRDRTVSGLVAAATLIAFPPTLLLAFFGANSKDVDSHHSILDLGRYGLAYATAWLPFVVLVVIGYFLLKRVSGRSGSLLARSRGSRGSRGGRGGSDGRVRVPAPRPSSGS